MWCNRHAIKITREGQRLLLTPPCPAPTVGPRLWARRQPQHHRRQECVGLLQDVLGFGPAAAGPSDTAALRPYCRAFARTERLDSSQRRMRCSLSLRERARVRGKETQPTKTPGRILQAQPDRLPQSVGRATQKQISRRALRTTGVSRQAHRCFERCFPLTPALPWGEGESPAAAWRILLRPRPQWRRNV